MLKKLNLKYFILTFFLILILILSGCFYLVVDKNRSKENLNNKNVVLLTGLLQYFSDTNEYVIIENPSSKSRVSYKIKKFNKKLLPLLKKYLDKIVICKVVILKKLSPWSYEVELLTIDIKKE